LWEAGIIASGSAIPEIINSLYESYATEIAAKKYYASANSQSTYPHTEKLWASCDLYK
jgi:hypothetical protein